MIILTLQATARSLDYGLWDMVAERTLLEGDVSNVGADARHRFSYGFGSGTGTTRAVDAREAVQRAWDAMNLALPSIERLEGALPLVEGVGHILPFPGPDGATGVRVTDAYIESLKGSPRSIDGDPGRMFSALNVLEEARRLFPEVSHVGVSDNISVMASSPESACYPVRDPQDGGRLVPRLMWGGVRIRAALESAAEISGKMAGSPRTVICDIDAIPHVTSFKARRIIDTTHEFDGTSRLMSERGCGAVAPGLRAAIATAGITDARGADRLLGEESGLACIEERSLTLADLAAMAENQTYGPASHMFFDQLVREIGGQITLLGGLDVLVFTGRWGFESPALRSIISGRLRLFRVSIDEGRNRSVQGPADISTEASRVRVIAVPPSPLWQAALETAQMLGDDV